jgi:lipoprotein NlpD
MIRKNSLPCRMLGVALVVFATGNLAGCVSLSPAPVVDHSSNSGGQKPAQVIGPGYHTVKKGDTLYSIALEYGQDYREIAGWNYITDPNLIVIGQSLRVLPPRSETAITTAVPVDSGAVVEQRPLDSVPPAALNTTTLKREPRVNKEPYSDARYTALQKPPQAPTAIISPPPAETTPMATATATTGGLSWGWPANGKVVGNFTQTKGVDIAGKAGDSVLAAADGRVVYVGNSLRGYGNLVIIKHNASYISVYAHNQKILVSEQQNVKRGQKIAEMGKTDSDSVKLHFEVRRQGNPVEPLSYLPKK